MLMNLIQEQTVIKSALLHFWSCKACRRMGWDKEHGCPQNNQDCGIFLYNRLKKHYEGIYKATWQVEAAQK